MSKSWDAFSKFVAAEVGVGGPDPQFKVIAHLSREVDPVERVWLIGCYGAHHCLPSAYAVWKEFRASDLVNDPYTCEKLYEWLDIHWDHLPVRPEMRSHRMIEKRWRCLTDFAAYAVSERWKTGSYEQTWDDSIKQVKYYSRYMAIKVLEMMRLTVRPDMVLQDLRAKNAWSPRITLGILFPEDEAILSDRDDNSELAIEIAEEYASEAILHLDQVYGIKVNHFQLQVLLCEFRELIAGGFYPGAGHDEEMDYIAIAEKKFDMSRLWKAREELFSRAHLGEHGGWKGLRPEKFTEWKALGKGLL